FHSEIRAFFVICHQFVTTPHVDGGRGVKFPADQPL
ncbi:MAG: hypothetical protein RLZZ553_1226, partial [Verrucomicrobiota bacterium]